MYSRTCAERSRGKPKYWELVIGFEYYLLPITYYLLPITKQTDYIVSN
ncbi:hypothetical protein JYQ62_25270 [Nostoc sp. UHCC 0702]|nr:hypothetical protein JYQ62_25270 [Nostoc sp. UHCC 0702]